MSIFNMIKSFMETFHKEKEATKIIRELNDDEKQALIKRVRDNFGDDVNNEEIFNQTIKLKKRKKAVEEDNNESESKTNL